jgi:glycosyltransferase involved in cell wall biosynthesis
VRILFLTENFPPETNAAATRVFERACYWVKWGHQVDVLTCAPNFPQGKIYPGYTNGWHQVETMAGMRVVRVKTYISANEGFARRTLDFLSFMVTAFVAGFFERKPDVVIATSPQFFAAVGGWALALARRRPFIFELGDLWPASIIAVGAMQPSLAIRWLEKFELFLYRQSARVVALTESFKRDLIRRGIDACKIDVVINGVDLPRYAPRIRDDVFEREWKLGGKFVVGYIGTLGMAHGLANVLDAAEHLRGRDDIRFLLVGPGAERAQLIAESERRGLANVIFAPSQPKGEMPRVWSVCDVALIHLKDSPVFAEVIPSKMFEAMAMGLPLLVAAPPGEATRIAENDGAGLCVPAGDPLALTEAVARLKDNPELREKFARQSLAAAPRHSRETQARNMLNAIMPAVGAVE